MIPSLALAASLVRKSGTTADEASRMRTTAALCSVVLQCVGVHVTRAHILQAASTDLQLLHVPMPHLPMPSYVHAGGAAGAGGGSGGKRLTRRQRAC